MAAHALTVRMEEGREVPLHDSPNQRGTHCYFGIAKDIDDSFYCSVPAKTTPKERLGQSCEKTKVTQFAEI